MAAATLPMVAHISLPLGAPDREPIFRHWKACGMNWVAVPRTCTQLIIVIRVTLAGPMYFGPRRRKSNWS